MYKNGIDNIALNNTWTTINKITGIINHKIVRGVTSE